ncbi:hypothetical protein E8F12_01755 [Pseudomonas sp. BN102]|nr:hypothetical protein [Pseudomonas sp. BN102]
MCALELEKEWRPKLKPDDACAKLIAEARRFVTQFEKGDIRINEVCTKDQLMEAADNAAATIAKARERGWATLEEYLNY